MKKLLMGLVMMSSSHSFAGVHSWKEVSFNCKKILIAGETHSLEAFSVYLIDGSFKLFKTSSLKIYHSLNGGNSTTYGKANEIASSIVIADTNVELERTHYSIASDNGIWKIDLSRSDATQHFSGALTIRNEEFEITCEDRTIANMTKDLTR